MPYEIFVSYSRKAPRLCDQVVEILETRLGYADAVFVDREGIAGGTRWKQEILDAIDQADYLLVLATDEAKREPSNILDEVTEARKRNTEVIPVEFDGGAAEALLGERDTQYILAPRVQDSCLDPDKLERDLRRALTHRAIRNLEEYRKTSLAWVRENFPASSFWEGIWEGLFNESDPVAIVAPAGRGKSVIAAHFVRRQCTDPNICPILLSIELVARGVEALARDLGARAGNDIATQLEILHKKHAKRVIFLVDGLDQIRLPDDPNSEQIVKLLTVLSASGSSYLVLTCRDDVWDVTYRSRLPFAVKRVDNLDDRRLDDILRLHDMPLEAAGNPLLKTPFFLDLAIREKRKWSSIPKTDIQFFQRLFQEVREDVGPRPEPLSLRKNDIIYALATLQVRELTYEIPRHKVEDVSGLRSDVFQQALASLKDERLMLERSPSALLETDKTPTLRLAHDLLDCFSMANVVYRSHDKERAVRDICASSERESGWSVLSMLVRLAHHYEDETLLYTLFQNFLYILDRKKFDDQWMARAWAVTYVLRGELEILLPLVLKALSGRAVESLSKNCTTDPSQQGSSITGDPRLTPEAASSVASAFLGLIVPRAADVTRVVPVLATGLTKWPLKGRFVDALARYRTDEVRAILVNFGNKLPVWRCLGPPRWVIGLVGTVRVGSLSRP